MTTSDAISSRESIVFDGGNEASVVTARRDADAAQLAERLGLRRGRPVLVVVGGADTLAGAAQEVAARVVGPAVVRAVAASGAVVVDGGTATGVMAIVGEALADRLDGDAELVGVAPAPCVSYPSAAPQAADGRTPLEPHHSHFVLADVNGWGEETEMLIALVETLAGDAPVTMLIAGGGEGAKKEIRQATKRRWPVFAVEGTGGIADELAAHWRLANGPPWRWRSHPPAPTTDHELEEAAVEGDLRPYRDRDPVDLGRRLAWELQDLPVLKHAWARFATYDALAGTARKSFEHIQFSILALGIAATFLALLKGSLDIGATSRYAWIDDAMHWTVVALPVLVGVLAAAAIKLGSGKRWVLLRAAAEGIKSEIYRFRTRTGAYRDLGGKSPQETLAAQLDVIETKLRQTEASSAELTPYSGPLPPRMYGASTADDGLTTLDAEEYIELRIGDQLGYYHPKIRDLARRLRLLQLLALVGGATGAILAAAGLEVWIGLTTAIASATLAYLGYLQIESTLVAYNQCAGKLESLTVAWRARARASRDQDAFDELVADAEAVLSTEHGGWVQQMSEALEDLKAKQQKDAEASSSKPS